MKMPENQEKSLEGMLKGLKPMPSQQPPEPPKPKPKKPKQPKKNKKKGKNKLLWAGFAALTSAAVLAAAVNYFRVPEEQIPDVPAVVMAAPTPTYTKTQVPTLVPPTRTIVSTPIPTKTGTIRPASIPVQDFEEIEDKLIVDLKEEYEELYKIKYTNMAGDGRLWRRYNGFVKLNKRIEELKQKYGGKDLNEIDLSINKQLLELIKTIFSAKRNDSIVNNYGSNVDMKRTNERATRNFNNLLDNIERDFKTDLILLEQILLYAQDGFTKPYLYTLFTPYSTQEREKLEERIIDIANKYGLTIDTPTPIPAQTLSPQKINLLQEFENIVRDKKYSSIDDMLFIKKIDIYQDGGESGWPLKSFISYNGREYSIEIRKVDHTIPRGNSRPFRYSDIFLQVDGQQEVFMYDLFLVDEIRTIKLPEFNLKIRSRKGSSHRNEPDSFIIEGYPKDFPVEKFEMKAELRVREYPWIKK